MLAVLGAQMNRAILMPWIRPALLHGASYNSVLPGTTGKRCPASRGSGRIQHARQGRPQPVIRDPLAIMAEEAQ